MSAFIPVPSCFDYYSFVIWFEIMECDASRKKGGKTGDYLVNSTSVTEEAGLSAEHSVSYSASAVYGVLP